MGISCRSMRKYSTDIWSCPFGCNCWFFSDIYHPGEVKRYWFQLDLIFSFQAKDAFSNIQSQPGAFFRVKISDSDSLNFQDSRATYIGQPPSSNLGRYSIPFRITYSGRYGVSVMQAKSGGLNGMYYQGANLSQPIFTRIDQQVFCPETCPETLCVLTDTVDPHHRWTLIGGKVFLDSILE